MPALANGQSRGSHWDAKIHRFYEHWRDTCQDRPERGTAETRMG